MSPPSLPGVSAGICSRYHHSGNAGIGVLPVAGVCLNHEIHPGGHKGIRFYSVLISRTLSYEVRFNANSGDWVIGIYLWSPGEIYPASCPGGSLHPQRPIVAAINRAKSIEVANAAKNETFSATTPAIKGRMVIPP